MLCKFGKNRANDPPLRGIYNGTVQFQIFKVSEDVNPHLWGDQGEIWQGEAAPLAKFHLY